MTLKNFRVRRADLNDLEHLVKFTAAEFCEAERTSAAPDSIHQGVEAALENETLGMYWVLVADDSKLIGSISVVKEWSDWHAGFYWWIQSMYIRSEFRGMGLMEKLLDVVIAEARGANALDLRLYVHKMNARAIKAYKKFGFSDAEYQIMKIDL
jgi:GNAT superfamily N-acetyltransferase